MKYIQTKPCAALAPYIHCFWELKGEEGDHQWERNFPDGCPGLVVNLGDTCPTDNGAIRMDPAKTYVAGAMRSYKDSFMDAHTHLLGVCLKPGVFSSFYSFVPQHELTDKTVELERPLAFDVDGLLKSPVHYLNGFFTNRLQGKGGRLQPVIDAIHLSNGQLSIRELAKRAFFTVRSLERNFKTEVGLTPKEYAGIVRFQQALSRIKKAGPGTNLWDIALDCGYYDHAHLTNEIKRNTGLAPSQL